MVAEQAYTSVRVGLVYDYMVNNAYFDGIQLYREEFATIYTYDAKGNLVKTRDLNGAESEAQVNANDDVTKETAPDGGESNYTYDDNRRLSSSTSAEGVKETYTYDTYGNNLSTKIHGAAATDPVIEESQTYTANGNYVATQTGDSRETVTNQWNTELGLLNQVTDPEGSAQSYTYDNMGNLTRTERVVGGATVFNAYTYQDDLLTGISHSNGADTSTAYTFTYNDLQQNVSTKVGSQTLMTNAYDSVTNLLTQSLFGNNQSLSFGYTDRDELATVTFSGDTAPLVSISLRKHR